MKCPSCNSTNDVVVDSREHREGDRLRRRRKCLDCEHRFTTYEQIPAGPVFRAGVAAKRDDVMAAVDRFIAAAGDAAEFLLPYIQVDIMDAAARMPKILGDLHVLKTPQE